MKKEPGGAVLVTVRNKMTSTARTICGMGMLVYQAVMLKQEPTRREMTAVCTVVSGVTRRTVRASLPETGLTGRAGGREWRSR